MSLPLARRDHFLARDFVGTYADAAGRLHLYGSVLTGLTDEIEELLGPRLRERSDLDRDQSGLFRPHLAIFRMGNRGEFF